MNKRVALSAAAILAVSAPAFAATPTIWYVAQNVKTSVCIVTPSKPNGTTYMMVGTDTFPTVAAATKTMNTATDCKKPTTVAAKTTSKPSGGSPTTTGSTGSPPKTTPSTPSTGY